MQLKTSSFLPLILLAVEATAFAAPEGHEFIAPKATDQRSPCPGLNTSALHIHWPPGATFVYESNVTSIFYSLANHGYLPRNGINFTIPQIMDAAVAGFNVNWDAILVAAKFGLLSGTDTGSFQAMSLGPLSIHNLVEHDASISRNDFGDGTGDNVHFNETTFSTLANANPGKNYYDPVAAGQVQRDRLAHSVATNPRVVNTNKEFTLRSQESALYLSIFGDPLTGIASKKFVQIFFREERLPFAEGWSKPKTLITGDTLDPIRQTIQNASEWTITTSCEPLVLGPHLVL